MSNHIDPCFSEIGLKNPIKPVGLVQSTPLSFHWM